ncbi:MAG: hypothetical protein CMI79_01535 [Candidatus Pelagibacter sp.]|nr:hypothetical protein [Candidatus Pelagibacter sp.]|tara:strand:+ start:7217 stop:8014 length:798 start_codon:yes stop_codon:yes gene_type:complete
MKLETLLSNTFFYRNYFLRKLLLKIYHFFVFLPFFKRKGPKIFINTLPKSGTHLLTAILGEIPGILNTRYNIDMWSIDNINSKHSSHSKWLPDSKEFSKKIKKIKGYQFMTGHLPFHNNLFNEIIESDIKMIYLTRDSSAVLKSNYKYITTLKRHYAHKTLMNDFKTKNDRLNALKTGFTTQKGYVVESLNTTVNGFNEWQAVHRSNILILSFEELIGSSRGYSDEKRLNSIKKILSFLDIKYDLDLIKKIDLDSKKIKSFTLRS